MCKLDELTDDFREWLSDKDECVWSDHLIEGAICAAAEMLRSLRPDSFSEREEVTLQPGCYQEFPQCRRILGFVSVNGNSCNRVTEKSNSSSLAFLDELYDGCSDSSSSEAEAYTPGEWDADENNKTGGWFENPVPNKGSVTAIINCLPKLDIEEGFPESICTEYKSALLDFTLFRLYLVDTKSGTMPAIADRHYRSGFDHLGLKLDMDFALSQANYELGSRVE